MRHATVRRYPGRTWWETRLVMDGQVWPMAQPTWALAFKAADRWTRGLHPIACCPTCETLGR